MTCPDCQRFKESAANWRRKAYELNGTPLPVDEDDLPDQHLTVGRFMLSPHPDSGYWLTDMATGEGMQVFSPLMEQMVKDLWKRF